MHYPLVLSSHKRIVIAPAGWFAPIGRICPADQTIEIAINRLGEKSLAWFLDARGQFFALDWQGKLPKSLLQKIGLLRQHELYSIGNSTQIAAGSMLDLIADHREQFEETSNTADFRKVLLAIPKDAVLGPEFMQNYLGQPTQSAA